MEMPGCCWMLLVLLLGGERLENTPESQYCETQIADEDQRR
jgi:hypothetical protein